MDSSNGFEFPIMHPMDTGLTVTLDPEDYERLSLAMAKLSIKSGCVHLCVPGYRSMALHKVLLGLSSDDDVIFLDGNRRNMRRENLRPFPRRAIKLISKRYGAGLPDRRPTFPNTIWVPPLQAWTSRLFSGSIDDRYSKAVYFKNEADAECFHATSVVSSTRQRLETPTLGGVRVAPTHVFVALDSSLRQGTKTSDISDFKVIGKTCGFHPEIISRAFICLKG